MIAEVARDVMVLQVQVLSQAGALADLYLKRAKYRREYATALNPLTLQRVEVALGQELPGFDVVGKPLSETARKRLLEEAMATRSEYLSASALAEWADLGLKDFDAQISAAQVQFQGTRAALEALVALARMGEK